MNTIPSLVAAMALALISTPGAQADNEVVKGRQLAERLCATCHMGPGQGEKKSEAEIPGFAAIANRPNQTDEGILNWLRSIPPMMPNHHLDEDEMFALSRFIMSLRERTEP